MPVHTFVQIIPRHSWPLLKHFIFILHFTKVVWATFRRLETFRCGRPQGIYELFHGVAMATLSMRNILINYILQLLWNFTFLRKQLRDERKRFLSGSLSHRYLSWSQPFLNSVVVTFNCRVWPHIWPNSVQTQCVTYGQTATLDQILPWHKHDFVNAEKIYYSLTRLVQN